MKIRKYPNRRLYDVDASRYVNLTEVADRVRNGDDLAVEDAATGRDLTHEVLMQIALETLQGADLLPVSLLRRVIRAAGSSPLEVALRAQLATGIALLCAQLDRMEAMFPRQRPSEPRTAPPPPPQKADDLEMETLRAHLSALEARLGR